MSTRYRYTDYTNNGGIRKASLILCPIIHKTSKGAWILCNDAKRRFVLDGTGKRYVYEHIEDAKQSFFIRKIRQKELLERQLRDCNEMLALTINDLPTQPFVGKSSLSNAEQALRCQAYYDSIY